MNRWAALRRACALALGLAAATACQSAVEVFRDDFDVPGDRLDLGRWTTEIGPSSFLGRTQLQDWVTPGGVGKFVVSGGQARLALQTYNPTGFSLFGTHAKTLASFQPDAVTGYRLSARLQLQSLQPGLVFGLYFYGCSAGPCATQHDELDIELVTNFLQPGATPRVQLNRYANEPLGAGHGVIADLPAGFDALAPHDWTLVWRPDSVSWLVDGTLLYSASSVIPQGRMQANLIAWGPAPDWAAAYSAALQPTGNGALNQSFVALVDAISVSAVPEPAAWTLAMTGLALVFRAARQRQA